MVELQKFLLLNQFIVELLKVFGFAGVFGLDELDKPPLKLTRSLFDVLQRVTSKVSHTHLMTFGVEMTFEAILILALLPTQFAKVFESP